VKLELFDENLKRIQGKQLVTPNLTLDHETGRTNGWSKKDFIDRFLEWFV
jgi:hypothetical protein